jgi:2-heptyl-3-hydroxy-4(1H)-quinolone synthase
MSSENHVPRVLVVGAGIAGLAAAGAIVRLGWEVSVVEQRAHFDGVATGLFVPANGVRALAALGLLAAVARRGQAISLLRARGADGAAESVARLERVWPQVGPSIGIRRSSLQDALLAALLGAAEAPVRMGVRLAGLVPDGRAVRARFGDGETGSYDLVVGADGASSAVRGLLWSGSAARYGGESWWRGVVRCPRDLTDWTLTLCRAGNVVAIPVGSGLVYWGAGVSRREPFQDAPAGRAARVRAQFADAAGVAAAVLDQVTEDSAVQFSSADTAWVDNPVAGHVVLIGDAWHATTPSMAQGAAMAAEDALALAQELGRDPRPGGIGEALGRFAARRLPRVRHVQETTDFRNQIAALPLEGRVETLVPRWEELSVASFAPLVRQP